MTIRGFNFQTELTIPVNYKDSELETGLRCDLLVEESLVVELKAIEKVLPRHESQILTYMNLLEIPRGVIINLNATQNFKLRQ